MAWRTCYLAVRRWVDRDLKENQKPFSLWPGMLALVLGGAMQTGAPLVRAIGWSVLLAAALWLAFVIWRGIRQFRSGVLRGDRKYDQRTKYALPPEYRDSESLTATRQRERREAKRQG